MKKKTKKKIVEIIIKSGLVITLALGVIGSICSFIYGDDYLYTKMFFSVFLVVGITTMTLIYKFPYTIERVKVKAHEFPLNISNFDDFIKYLDNNMSEIGYEKFPYLKNYNELACVYYKKTRNTLEYYSVYHFDEIKETKAKTCEYVDELISKEHQKQLEEWCILQSYSIHTEAKKLKRKKFQKIATARMNW